MMECNGGLDSSYGYIKFMKLPFQNCIVSYLSSDHNISLNNLMLFLQV